MKSRQLAQYGIFVSNSRGPGLITDSYASNMADAAYYVGACRRVCDMTLAHDTGVNSASGIPARTQADSWSSGIRCSGSTGPAVVPDSMNNDDAPPPQDGRCPGSATRSCTIIEDNLIQANNNAMRRGTMPPRPSGPGVQIAWGSVRHGDRQRYRGSGLLGDTHQRKCQPTSSQPPPGTHCQGGIKNDPLPKFCLFQARGNLVYSERVQRRRVLRQPDEL